MPKVSIIVPIYNAKTSLHKCVDSILKQSLKDLEVILVNDGSEDGSGKICDEYAEMDSRVRVLHIKNQGISNARNKGLELARGDYIGFVDSDDWIEADMYSEMMNNLISTGSDIVMCGHLIYDGKTEYHVGIPWGKEGIFESNEIHKVVIPAIISPIDIYGNKQQILKGAVWKCLFKQKTLKETGILFNVKIKYTEDTVFVVETLSKSKKISFVDKAYYHYRRENGNRTSVTQNYIKDLYPGLKISQEIICNIIRENGHLALLQKHLHWRHTALVMSSISNLCRPGSPYNFKNKVKKARFYIRDSNFLDSLKVVGINYFPPKQKILALLMKHSFVASIITYYSLKYLKG